MIKGKEGPLFKIFAILTWVSSVIINGALLVGFAGRARDRSKQTGWAVLITFGMAYIGIEGMIFMIILKL